MEPQPQLDNATSQHLAVPVLQARQQGALPAWTQLDMLVGMEG